MSTMIDLCDTAALRLQETGVLPAGTVVLVHRQQDELRKVQAAVGKQTGAVLLYPVRALRDPDHGADSPLDLEIVAEVYTAPTLRPAATPAADLAEMVFDALDGWLPPTGAASVTTALGSNADLTWTWGESGGAGVGKVLQYIHLPVPDSVLDVQHYTDVSPELVVVLATNGAGVITTTANQILAWLAAHPAFTAATAALAPGSNGTGTVAAIASATFASAEFLTHLFDELVCTEAELIPDDTFLVWRVTARARRFLNS